VTQKLNLNFDTVEINYSGMQPEKICRYLNIFTVVFTFTILIATGFNAISSRIPDTNIEQKDMESYIICLDLNVEEPMESIEQFRCS